MIIMPLFIAQDTGRTKTANHRLRTKKVPKGKLSVLLCGGPYAESQDNRGWLGRLVERWRGYDATPWAEGPTAKISSSGFWLHLTEQRKAWSKPQRRRSFTNLFPPQRPTEDPHELSCLGEVLSHMGDLILQHKSTKREILGLSLSLFLWIRLWFA